MAHQPDAGGRGEGEAAALSAAGGDTIAAVATAPGRGAVGIVRISGPLAFPIARVVTGIELQPRVASLAEFRAADGALLDEGLVLAFPQPRSYTGDDVVELQGHGGPVVLASVLTRCVELGARLAGPGEFTQRAFLNGRMDLAQAEAVADLIDASSAQAALGAARSLSGAFSTRVREVVALLTELRVHVEACIDFPEEDIAPADRAWQSTRLACVTEAVRGILAQAEQGVVLREGLHVVIAGRPNVGKSTLLNALAREELAIVTEIPGTTRDPIRAAVHIEGVPFHLVDTAGLRASDDPIERIGIERAWAEVEKAGALLIMDDGTGQSDADGPLADRLPPAARRLRISNKVDLRGAPAGWRDPPDCTWLEISAQTGAGLDLLRQWLLEAAGWRSGSSEGVFTARARHLVGLKGALAEIEAAGTACEYALTAEGLRLAQRELSALTGEVSADDLLGQIFSHFCIGK